MARDSSVVASDLDGRFFVEHPDRFTRIRMPRKALVRNHQRAVRVLDECENEFRSLGDHNGKRRRIILWRVPPSHPLFNPMDQQILKIPFLLNADETVEDRDDILLPIIHELMRESAYYYAGMNG